MTAMDTTAIVGLLAGLAPVGCHASWRRFDVDARTWIAIARLLGAGKPRQQGLFLSQRVKSKMRSPIYDQYVRK
jgi:hypothetical protein